MEKLRTLHMNGGNDETSYANNSIIQKAVISRSLPLLDATLREMFRSSNSFPKWLRIADLGCSSGPNTLFVISHIMETVEKLCREVNVVEIPELEVFLNDLPSNDFNNLFKLLPNMFHSDCVKTRPKCFVTGLPGSFYERLFPNKSLHFAFSSYSLQWLSQVPKGVEKDNKNNICIAMTSPKEVLEAYARQFQRDLSQFLRCRAEEIVPAGRVFFTLIGRSVQDISKEDVCGHFRILFEVLSDMVDEGLVSEGDLCSFNIPYYTPCPQEVDAIIRAEGSFNVDKMEFFELPWDSQSDEWVINTHISGKLVADCTRAVNEPLLSQHFGCGIMDDLFDRYAKKVASHLSNKKPFNFNINVSLSRN